MEHRRVPPTMISVNGVGTPSVMASPASSVGTPKMNGSLHQSQRHQTLNNGSKFGHSSNTPIPRQGLDVSSRETFSHSLHDTSQELSRSVLSTGPRLRTPNPIPTPIPLLASGQNFNPSVSSGVSPVPPPHTNPSVPVHSDAALMHDSSPLSSVSLQESLASLALLCVVSVLLAFLAVLFLMKVMPMSIVDGRPGPGPGLCNISALTSHIVDIGEYRLVYEVVIGLATCTISLDFTCLLICCAQFIFASKLAKTSYGRDR